MSEPHEPKATIRRVDRRTKEAKEANPSRFQPKVGLLPPRGEETIVLAVPMNGREQPVVVTPRPLQVVILDATDETVRVRNQTDAPVPYAFFVAPKLAVRLAQVDWRGLLGKLAGFLGGGG
jgi:hypothetical protein